MVTITALWLPILLASVLVFIASAIIHMVLPYHKGDYKKLPNEEEALEGLRKEKVSPGDYAFPFPDSPKDISSPEMAEKYRKGPVGLLTILPSAPPAMGKSLFLWFIFILIVGIFTAYVSGRSLGKGRSDWGYAWVPVFGPLIGGVLGAYGYYLLGFEPAFLIGLHSEMVEVPF